jgi:hypothetical protein
MRPDADPSPAPLVLADMLAIHAWSPHIDEATRTLCGWAADSLRLVAREAARQTAQREVAEAETDMYRRIAYGPQKGGAA